MSEPLAFFLTWTTYGTWLPGEERGWVKRGKGFQPPQPVLKANAQARMTESLCTLNAEERELVEKTIAKHCRIRGWKLHAVNCRSNHVHVVISANRDPKDIRDELKAWCTRELKKHARNRAARAPDACRSSTTVAAETPRVRSNWWTEGGSQRYIGDEESLEAVIRYVLEAQDKKGNGA